MLVFVVVFVGFFCGFLFFVFFVCIRRSIHNTDMCVNTDITGGSTSEGG